MSITEKYSLHGLDIGGRREKKRRAVTLNMGLPLFAFFVKTIFLRKMNLKEENSGVFQTWEFSLVGVFEVHLFCF